MHNFIVESLLLRVRFSFKRITSRTVENLRGYNDFFSPSCLRFTLTCFFFFVASRLYTYVFYDFRTEPLTVVVHTYVSRSRERAAFRTGIVLVYYFNWIRQLTWNGTQTNRLNSIVRNVVVVGALSNPTLNHR